MTAIVSSMPARAPACPDVIKGLVAKQRLSTGEDHQRSHKQCADGNGPDHDNDHRASGGRLRPFHVGALPGHHSCWFPIEGPPRPALLPPGSSPACSSSPSAPGFWRLRPAIRCFLAVEFGEQARGSMRIGDRCPQSGTMSEALRSARQVQVRAEASCLHSRTAECRRSRRSPIHCSPSKASSKGDHAFGDQSSAPPAVGYWSGGRRRCPARGPIHVLDE